MLTTRATHALRPLQETIEAGENRLRDLERCMRRREQRSLGWSIAGMAAVALVVAAGISLWPDFVRYMRIRNM
jgi:hypothetical protein